MSGQALVAVVVLVGIVAWTSCGFGDSGLEADVSRLESQIREIQETIGTWDFESRVTRLEESLYGSSELVDIGVRGVLDRLHEVERDVRALEQLH